MALTELASSFKARGLGQEQQQVRPRGSNSRDLGTNYCTGVSISLRGSNEGIAGLAQ